MRYGADGYALYWMCLELIAKKVDQNNLTFELEHDAEILGYRLKVDQMRVQEIMTYMIDLGLFERRDMAIYCYKLAKRVDVSMFPPNHRERVREELNELLDPKKNNESVISHDESVISHDESVISHERLDQIRSNKYKESFVEEKSPTKKKPKFTFSDSHMKFAKYMHQKILEVMPRAKKPNFEKWAHEVRLAEKALGVSLTDLWNVFIWANADGFWKTNILSPSKLRDKFPQLEVKKNEAYQSGYKKIPTSTTEPETAGDRLRNRLRSEGYDV
ncbi:putative origin specific replication initiation factor [Vibrio phage vB_Vp_PvVp04_M]|nr:putative origin specific replication initiation factor [Vibrio phage vB_Vp_PvVp04_M]